MTPVEGPSATPLQSATAIKRAARDFEAVFAGEMAKLLLESVAVDEQFGGGHGETMFRGVLAEQLGKELASQGGFGIAPAVLQQMLKVQGEGQ